MPHPGMHQHQQDDTARSPAHVCQHTPHLAQPSGPHCVLLRFPQSPRLPKRKACAVSPPVSGYLPRPRLQPGKLMLTRPEHKCTASTFGPGPGTLALSPKTGPPDPRLITPKALLPSIGSLLTISRAFNSLFKVLFNFPSQYLFAIGLVPIFSFR